MFFTDKHLLYSSCGRRLFGRPYQLHLPPTPSPPCSPFLHPPQRATRAPPRPPPPHFSGHIAPKTTIVWSRTTPVARNAQRAPPTPPSSPPIKPRPQTQLNTKRVSSPPPLGRSCGRLRANRAFTSVPRVPSTSTWRNWWSKHNKRAPTSPFTSTYLTPSCFTNPHTQPVAPTRRARGALRTGASGSGARGGHT
jgi:hypothetical protein